MGHLRLWGVIYLPPVLTKTQAAFLFWRAGQASLFVHSFKFLPWTHTIHDWHRDRLRNCTKPLGLSSPKTPPQHSPHQPSQQDPCFSGTFSTWSPCSYPTCPPSSLKSTALKELLDFSPWAPITTKQTITLKEQVVNIWIGILYIKLL